MNNHPSVSISKGIRDLVNKSLCSEDRAKYNFENVHSYDAMNSVGIFQDVDDNDADEEFHLLGNNDLEPDTENNMTFWLEGKELELRF
jgi:hypothetical protein